MQTSWYLARLGLCRQLNMHENAMNIHMKRLSTGKRINSAADDPAGLCISEKMKAQIRGLEAAKRNTQDGISLIQVADGNLATTHNILQRLNELAVESSNGTYTDEDRKCLDIEFQELLKEINTIGKNTEFNNDTLFDGDGASDEKSVYLQLGGNANQGIELNIEKMNVDSIGLNGINILTQDDAMNAINKLKDAISDISHKRAYLGASQNRLEYSMENLDNYSENLQAAESRIEDCDIAKEAMAFAKESVLCQVTQSLFAQVQKQEESIVDLLKSMIT